MIKMLLCGLWVCVVTLASSQAVLMWRGGTSESVVEKAGAALATIRPGTISVPIIVEGAVQGYLVTQLSFLANSDKIKHLPVKPEMVFLDEAFKTIYAGESIDFRNLKRQDLAGLTKKIAENTNKRLGTTIVEDVLVQQLNYVPKDQARSRVNP